MKPLKENKFQFQSGIAIKTKTVKMICWNLHFCLDFCFSRRRRFVTKRKLSSQSSSSISPVAEKIFFTKLITHRRKIYSISSDFTSIHSHRGITSANAIEKCFLPQKKRAGKKKKKFSRQFDSPRNSIWNWEKRTRGKIKSDSMRTDDCAKNVWTSFALCSHFCWMRAGLKIAPSGDEI